MLDLKNTITNTKSTFDMCISIVDTAEEKVSKLTVSQQKSPKLNSKRKKKNFLKEQNIQEMQKNIKSFNMCIIVILEGQRAKKRNG